MSFGPSPCDTQIPSVFTRVAGFRFNNTNCQLGKIYITNEMWSNLGSSPKFQVPLWPFKSYFLAFYHCVIIPPPVPFWDKVLHSVPFLWLPLDHHHCIDLSVLWRNSWKIPLMLIFPETGLRRRWNRMGAGNDFLTFYMFIKHVNFHDLSIKK